MTRKDYVLLADALSAAMPCAGTTADEAWRDACNTVAARLAADNPRFDRARFLRACGMSE